MDLNGVSQFAMIIFCGDMQLSKLIEAFSAPVKRVPNVEKVETVVFNKRGFRTSFRDMRIRDAEFGVGLWFLRKVAATDCTDTHLCPACMRSALYFGDHVCRWCSGSTNTLSTVWASNVTDW